MSLAAASVSATWSQSVGTVDGAPPTKFSYSFGLKDYKGCATPQGGNTNCATSSYTIDGPDGKALFVPDIETSGETAWRVALFLSVVSAFGLVASVLGLVAEIFLASAMLSCIASYATVPIILTIPCASVIGAIVALVSFANGVSAKFQNGSAYSSCPTGFTCNLASIGFTQSFSDGFFEVVAALVISLVIIVTVAVSKFALKCS